MAILKYKHEGNWASVPYISGEKGDQGDSVSSVVLVSGNTSSGVTANYAIYSTSNTIIGYFEVYNGIDGTVDLSELQGDALPVTAGGTGLKNIATNNFLLGSGSGVLFVRTPAQVKTLIAAANGTAGGAANTIVSNNVGTTYYIGGVANAASGEGVHQHSSKISVTDGNLATTGSINANQVFGAVWNDFAEFREIKGEVKAGKCVCENGDDTLSLSSWRMQPAGYIVSDTYGFAIGETNRAKIPVAVAGRVLAYPEENRRFYKPGDAVCAGNNGTIGRMNRYEIVNYPERIIGYVSSIPNYKYWGESNIPVDGRIWIKV